MKHSLKRVLPLLLLPLSVVAGAAQTLPTAQPPFLRVIREDVKVGRGAEHARFEAGWPAAYERVKSPDYYLALDALTGTGEAWYLVPAASYAAMGEQMARDEAPEIAGELIRLRKGDTEFINGARVTELRARPDLSFGTYPDLGKQRVWEISIFRMRPGAEDAFSGMAKGYGAATGRLPQNVGYRVYEVLTGMPAPTYFVFWSGTSFADFDKVLAVSDSTMKGMNADELGLAKKFTDGLVNSETFHFRLSPEMSYVPKAVKAGDPGFWMPKKAAAPKPAAAPAKPAAQ
jgi:hypothetical protein